MEIPLGLLVCVTGVSGSGKSSLVGDVLEPALRARLGDQVTFVGVGGAKMAEQGVESPFDIAQLSILGIWEGLKAYPTPGGGATFIISIPTGETGQGGHTP